MLEICMSGSVREEPREGLLYSTRRNKDRGIPHIVGGYGKGVNHGSYEQQGRTSDGRGCQNKNL
jgi:hypothetical protein